jgi:poly-beta-hydroxybutyrate-responsive repressor
MATQLQLVPTDRYVQPSILMSLLGQGSYGYELSQKICSYGFLPEDASPGMIYRHLRQLEKEGLITSHWDSEGSGPARRMYTLTAEGHEVLDAWVRFIKRRAKNFARFVACYAKASKETGA